MGSFLLLCHPSQLPMRFPRPLLKPMVSDTPDESGGARLKRVVQPKLYNELAELGCGSSSSSEPGDGAPRT